MSIILTDEQTPNCKDCFHYQPATEHDREEDHHTFAKCRKGSQFMPYAHTHRMHPARTAEYVFSDPDLFNCGTEGTWFEPILDVPRMATSAATRFALQIVTLLILMAIGAGLTIAVTEPDHVSGKTSNDAGWVK